MMVLSACGGPTAPDGGGPPGAGECAVTIAQDITIPTRLANLGDGCDYRVEGDVRIASELTIDAGTEVQFAQDSRWHIGDTGSIIAVGTQDSQITLRGAINTTGYWYGLCFSNNRASQLVWVNLLNAGKVWTGGSSNCRAAIGHGYGDGEPISIVDTLVAGAQTTGLDATKLNLGTFARNIFAANKEYGVRVSANNLQRLDTASDYSGASVDAPNSKNFVYLTGTLEDPGTTHVWPRLNAPYFIGEDEFGYHRNVIIDDGTSVEVDAGTTFVFGPEGSINIWGFSSFTAIGTTAEPVVFTGHVQVPGSWDGISASTGALHLEHAEVRWGGADPFYPGNVAVVGVDSVQESFIYDSLIKGSADCGIYTTDDTAHLVTVNEANVYEGNVTDICVN